MDIETLLEEAFFTDDAKRATAAIEQARARVEDQAKCGAFNLEVVVPKRPDEVWLRERVVRPLVYYCESSGATLPACTGVFLTFFHGDRVYCILGAEVLAWAANELQVGAETLAERYGTGEREHPAPRAPG